MIVVRGLHAEPRPDAPAVDPPSTSTTAQALPKSHASQGNPCRVGELADRRERPDINRRVCDSWTTLLVTALRGSVEVDNRIHMMPLSLPQTGRPQPSTRVTRMVSAFAMSGRGMTGPVYDSGSPAHYQRRQIESVRAERSPASACPSAEHGGPRRHHQTGLLKSHALSHACHQHRGRTWTTRPPPVQTAPS